MPYPKAPRIHRSSYFEPWARVDSKKLEYWPGTIEALLCFGIRGRSYASALVLGGPPLGGLGIIASIIVRYIKVYDAIALFGIGERNIDSYCGL